MDTYRLNDLKATVGMFGDFTKFKDVIDFIFETNPFKKALDIFNCDDVGDLSEAITNDKGNLMRTPKPNGATKCMTEYQFIIDNKLAS